MAKPKRPHHGSQQAGQRPAGATNTTAGASRATGGTGQARPAAQGAGTRSAEGAQAMRAAHPTATTARSARPTAGATENAGTGRYRPLSAREPQARGAQRRKQTQQPWWRQNLTTLIAVGSVLLLVAIFIGIAYFAKSSAPAGIGDPAPPSVLQPLESPNAAIFDQVGSGGVPNPFKHGNGGDFLKGPNGKPEFFYAGAEYCPYCAAERWSMIMSLSRFGSFSGLKLMTSADAPEVFPNTATFTFVDSTYKSDTIYLSSVETQDRSEGTLQTPTSQQTQILDKYNTKQYLGDNAGGIPFVSVANQYVTNGAGYSPGILDNLTWQQISGKLSNPKDPVTQDVVGNANWITAAICQTTNQSPASVCKTKAISDLEQKL